MTNLNGHFHIDIYWNRWTQLKKELDNVIENLIVRHKSRLFLDVRVQRPDNSIRENRSREEEHEVTKTVYKTRLDEKIH